MIELIKNIKITLASKMEDWFKDEVIKKLIETYISNESKPSILVDKQREMLLAYEEFTSYKVLGKKTPRISKQMVEDYLANNCD